MSMFSLQNPLRQLLSEYKLSHLYETLREKEFDSLDILKECSEDDVSALSQSLHLCLADKLRFKRALKSVNIPKHSVCYKIVNKEEQQYIVNIEKSLQRMQNMVGNNSISASNQELIKRNENVIHSSSDTLSSTYNDVEYTNKEIMNHLNTAKSIKKQCQQLLMKDDHLNDIDSRTNSIKNLHDECLKKEKMIANIVHRNISYKSQHITSRNAYNHTFSIPIYCGKTSHYENHITKLKISNNRRIVCGGLWWDIYIHPNQSENSNGFALSVFPVKSTMEDQLPDHYKLKYTVFTSLNITQMDEDEKSVSNFDASWHRELSHIVYDANVSHIEWQWTKERLPFSINDLIEYNDDNEYFNLYVRINTSFIMKKGARTSQYNGVLGAILLDSESVMGEQRKEIDTLKHNKDALQKQLETTNKLNVQLTDNMSKMMTQIAKLTKEQQRSNDIMKEITQSLQTQLSTQQSAIHNPSAFFNRSQSPVLNLQQQRGNNSHPSPSDTNTNTNKSKFEPATVTTHIAPNLPPVQPTNAKPTDVRTEEKKQAEEDHKQETVTTSNETILDSTDVITDTIDASWEVMFEHRPVRGWRYDEEQTKWRGRGRGQLMVYYHKEDKIGKMVFTDEKHNKTRLLQYIDGTHCEYAENDGVKSKDEVQWVGDDYTMDTKEPMTAKWKIASMEDDNAGKAFMKVFNDLIDAYNNGNESDYTEYEPVSSDNNNDNNDKDSNNKEKEEDTKHKENETQSTVKPMVQVEDKIIEQQQNEIAPTNDNETADNKPQDLSNVTTKDNASDDNNDPNGEEQTGFELNGFSFANNGNDENQNASSFAPGDADKVSWGDISCGFSTVKAVEGFGNATWGNDSGTGFVSFGASNSNEFDFGALIAEDKRLDTTGNESQTTKNDKKENNTGDVNNNNDDDNGNYTLKPIVSLSEVDVESGHKKETFLKAFEVIELYRWGKNVSSSPCWKCRARKTSLEFYQHNDSGKVRIVCRENITNKLRLNQMVTPDYDSVGKLEKKTEKQISWVGFDKTIEEEDEDEKHGYCFFAARFADEKVAHEFYKLYQSYSQNKSLNKK